MIEIDNIEFRELEEQVQFDAKRIDSILEGNKLLAELGIKVVGQVTEVEDIPPAVTYEGAYGDAYLVGTEAPYDYYIFTRPFAGQVEPQWFELGPFPVAGPRGEQGVPGATGAQGLRGSQWFSGSGQPTTTDGYNIGDYYINVGTGNIWHLHDVEGAHKWLLEGNIRGPQGPQGPQGIQGPQGEQGPQGPQGERGPAGPLVEIAGWATVEQLAGIDPESVPRQTGYLVPIDDVNHVYAIVGEEGNLMWEDVGIFGTGSLVYENGSPVPTFNADNKLDKISGTSKVYATTNSGTQTSITYATGTVGSTLVQRQSSGQIQVPGTPVNTFDAASKAYVDKRVPFPTTSYNVNTIQFVPAGKVGVANTIGMTSTVENNRVVQRTANAEIAVKSNVSLTADYAIGAKQVANLVNKYTNIVGENIPANTAVESAITTDDIGFFVILGPARIEYSLGVGSSTVTKDITSEYNLFFRYYEPNTGATRFIHIYFRAPSLSDFTVILREDGVLSSDVKVTNLATSSGVRIIKMPMSEPTAY